MTNARQPLSQGLAASIAQKFLADPASVQSPQTIPIEQIQLPAKQTRRYFDPNKQAQLVKSIQSHGILEPLLVRPLSNGNYELVAGERRYRAALELKLPDVPVVSRELDEKQALQIALLENLQREDLNSVEETEAILELLSITLNISNDQVCSLLHRANHAKNRGQELEENVFLQLQTIESVLDGVSRFSAQSFRTSRLPLLNLPDEILKALRCGQIEYTKARAIARVKNEEPRKKLLLLAISENLSLSEIKLKIQELNNSPKEIPSTSYVRRCDQIGQQLKKSDIWNDPDRLAKLDTWSDQMTKPATVAVPSIVLVIDLGGSQTKVIASVPASSDSPMLLCMEPEIADVSVASVRNYEKTKSGEVDPENACWVGIGDNYYTVGFLARHKYGGNSLLKQLKEENAVPKISGVLWVLQQKLKLAPKLTVRLTVLLPPSEYQDRERLEAKLRQELRLFNTPTGEMRVKLVDFNAKPEGGGIYLYRRSMLGANIRNRNMAVVMLGHRNASVLVSVRGAVAPGVSSTFGMSWMLDDFVRRCSGLLKEDPPLVSTNKAL